MSEIITPSVYKIDTILGCKTYVLSWYLKVQLYFIVLFGCKVYRSDTVCHYVMLLNRKVVNINPDMYKDTAKQKLGRTWLAFHDEITQGSYMKQCV